MATYYLNGTINAAGHLVQYATFRYHSAVGSPRFMFTDWWHNNGADDKYMRVGLRNSAGTQVTNSLQFNPGETHVWKTWNWIGAGSYALNMRSAPYDYGASTGFVTWTGQLWLS